MKESGRVIVKTLELVQQIIRLANHEVGSGKMTDVEYLTP